MKAVNRPSFFEARPTTLGALAQRVGLVLSEAGGPLDPTYPIHRACDFPELEAFGLGFLEAKSTKRFGASLPQAGVCLATAAGCQHLASVVSPELLCVRHPHPRLFFYKMLGELYPEASEDEAFLWSGPDVHATATLGEGVVLGRGVRIGPGARVGPRTIIGNYTCLGPSTEIGADCRLGSHTTLACARVSTAVRIGDNCTIGGRGFGYVPHENAKRRMFRVPHIGGVTIEAEAEIGNQCNIERGTLTDTRIGARSRLGTVVQVAHNCCIGADCVLVSCVGLAGHVTLGDGVRLGGQVGVADGVRIGDDVIVSAQAGVQSHIPSGAARYAGDPARENRFYLRERAILSRLARQYARVPLKSGDQRKTRPAPAQSRAASEKETLEPEDGAPRRKPEATRPWRVRDTTQGRSRGLGRPGMLPEGND